MEISWGGRESESGRAGERASGRKWKVIFFYYYHTRRCMYNQCTMYVHSPLHSTQDKGIKQGRAAVRAIRAVTPQHTTPQKEKQGTRIRIRSRRDKEGQRQERFLCPSRTAEKKKSRLTKYCSICNPWYPSTRGSRHMIPRKPRHATVKMRRREVR